MLLLIDRTEQRSILGLREGEPCDFFIQRGQCDRRLPELGIKHRQEATHPNGGRLIIGHA